MAPIHGLSDVLYTAATWEIRPEQSAKVLKSLKDLKVDHY